MDDALAELGGAGADSYVRVMKHDSDTSKTGWGACGKVSASEFDPFAIAQTWGPGRYRFEFCRGDAKGKYRSVTWTAVPTLEQRAADSGMTRLGSPRALERDPETDTRRGSSRDDFLEKMVLVLLEARNTPAPQTSMTDLIAGLHALKELTAADKPQTTQETVLEAIRTGSELAGLALGGGNEGSMLERFAPQVFKLLDGALSAHRNGGAGAGAPPQSPASPQLPEHSPAQAAPADDPVIVVLRQWAPQVVAEAAAGRDPRTWAYFLAERTPEAWLPVLERIVTAEESERNQLAVHISPAIEPHLAWLSEACEAFREYFAPDDSGDTAAPAPMKGTPDGAVSVSPDPGGG